MCLLVRGKVVRIRFMVKARAYAVYRLTGDIYDYIGPDSHSWAHEFGSHTDIEYAVAIDGNGTETYYFDGQVSGKPPEVSDGSV
jgi:hypothetical protein